MVDEVRYGDRGRIAASRSVRHRSDGVDFISSMPDEILHHILSFIPTQFAIRISSLSRRWRHVWCETPCLDFDCVNNKGFSRAITARGINQTLKSYRARKIMSFNLSLSMSEPDSVPEHYIDNWIEFIMCRYVEKLTFRCFVNNETYGFQSILYLSYALKQLSIWYISVIPKCTVAWKSLRKLTLGNCYLYDESIANILAGSPILETLELYKCGGSLQRLDLSKSLRLRRLEIDRELSGRSVQTARPMEIVAPHIRYLSLRIFHETRCILVDVSSLTEASLDICTHSYRFVGEPRPFYLVADLLQTMVLQMLAKLQNVERLTFKGTVLQILSLPKLGGDGVPFPTLKVQTLTVETEFARSFIPGIATLLQNSPGLKMLIAQAALLVGIKDRDIDSHLDSRGLRCWRSNYEVFPTSIEYYMKLRFKDAALKLMASFMEMVLRNVKTLETLVVELEHLRDLDKAKWFEELLQLPPTLSNNNNVSIVLKR